MSVSDALTYLAESIDEHADAIRQLDRLEALAKNFLSELIMRNTGAFNQREALARSNADYKSLTEEQIPDARRAVQFHKNKTKWAESVIEVWRTQNANKRAAERVR